MAGMKTTLGLLGMAAALMSGSYAKEEGGNPLRPEDIDVKPKETPVPKGCTRYYFNKEGICRKGEHLVYFDAIKERNAIKKWERWLNK